MSETATQTMTAEAVVIDAPKPRDAHLLQTIRAARAGDNAAFEEIMIQTERHVAQIAWRILGDAEEVKDAMQETFLRLFRFLGRYDERHDFFGWLSRITINVCRDAQRRQKRGRIFEPLEDDVGPVSDDPAADDDLIRRADVAMLRRAIDMLAPKERMAILLRDVEGLSTADVAAALGNTVATVRVQLSRARVKLRRLVASWRGGAT